MEFKDLIQKCLDEQNWGVPELRVALRAQGIDLSESTLGRWLTGLSEPRWSELVALGRVPEFIGIWRFFTDEIAK